MKRIPRSLSFILVFTLLCTLCTGCMSITVNTKINADGSGEVATSFGVQEAVYRQLYEEAEAKNPRGMSFEDFMAATAVEEGLMPYTYAGATYWGGTETLPFATVEEFNTLLFTDDNGEANDWGSLVRDENGDFTLTLVLTRDAAAEASGEEELTAEDLALMQEMGEQMPMHYSFVFPETIGRASGALNCLSLNGNHVLIDLLKAIVQLENSGEEALTFVFSTKDPSFSDTPLTMWYTAAVEAMAGGGLVEGGGDGCFYPDKTLTVSEFAQILAKATGMPVGAGDGGYWAELALEGCRDAGYITDRGDATRANYEIPIERQEAVAAMQRAGKRTPTGSFTAADIPDFDAISPALRADILAAYNSGVTKGTDDLRTFVPAGVLSRGQVCQLFSNLQWTAPLG